MESVSAIELKKVLEAGKALAVILEKAKADGKVNFSDLVLLPEVAVQAAELAKVQYKEIKGLESLSKEEVKELVSEAVEFCVAVLKAIKK